MISIRQFTNCLEARQELLVLGYDQINAHKPNQCRHERRRLKSGLYT
jgi:hypothetical protein